MSLILEQTFLQRRPTNGQKLSGTILNVTNRQGNGNPTHDEILPPTYQNGYYPKTKTTGIGQDVGKLELLYTISINVKWYSHGGKQYGIMEFPQQLKNRTMI